MAAREDRARADDHRPAARRRPSVFPPMVVQMIGVGEQTRRPRRHAHQDRRLLRGRGRPGGGRLLTLMEPVMILFLGITVGGIVIAMYLPLFDLISKLT